MLAGMATAPLYRQLQAQIAARAEALPKTITAQTPNAPMTTAPAPTVIGTAVNVLTGNVPAATPNVDVAFQSPTAPVQPAGGQTGVSPNALAGTQVATQTADANAAASAPETQAENRKSFIQIIALAGLIWVGFSLIDRR